MDHRPRSPPRHSRSHYWKTVLSKDPTDGRSSHSHLLQPNGYQSSRRQSLSTNGNHHHHGHTNSHSIHLHQLPSSSASSSSLHLPNKSAFKTNASNTSDLNHHTPLTANHFIDSSTCPFCESHFKRRYDLVQHISAVHEKRRPYACDSCDQAFAHKGTLSKHVRTVHRKEKPYACEHCGQRFSERGNVNKHKQRTARCRDAESIKLNAMNLHHPHSSPGSIRK